MNVVAPLGPQTQESATVSDQNSAVTVEVALVNRQGLHARPVMRFVDVASTFASDIVVDRGEGTEQVDGKSPMHMMLLAAPKGTRLRIMAKGADAGVAVEALVELVRGGFGED